jgi:phage terminase Nu1 subunit (DNA packaging protein)
MENTIENQYEVDDIEDVTIDNTKKVVKINNGPVQLFEVNGQKISVIDPAVVLKLQASLVALQRKVDLLEHDLRQAKAKQRRTDQRIGEVTRELDSKVGYE